jgi:hypothetical protein
VLVFDGRHGRDVRIAHPRVEPVAPFKDRAPGDEAGADHYDAAD